MTVSSLLKKMIGVKGIVIDGAEIEDEAGKETLVIEARPTKYESCRCPICGRKCALYDQGKGERRWRSLDIGNSLPVVIEAKAPRILCKIHGVLVQRFPWARHGSRFTKAFEETGVWLSLHASRTTVSQYLRVSWDTVGPMVSRVEAELSANQNRLNHLVRIGIDETSYKKGHKYITVIVDHDSNTVIWVGKKHGKSVLESFFGELTEEQKASIQYVTGDGARWIKDTVMQHCPNATFCIDPFHVVSWMTEVLDQVRREEWNKARAELAKAKKEKNGKVSKAKEKVDLMKSSKYPLLMNPDSLSEPYQAKLSQILLENRRLATAYRLKEELRLIFKLKPEEVRPALMKWRRRAWSSRNPLLVELQRKIKRHIDAIVATVEHGLSNARVEATNNKIKLTVRMAYGFRNIDNLIAMIMLRCGGLSVALPGRAA